jgi:hypothetical protein
VQWSRSDGDFTLRTDRNPNDLNRLRASSEHSQQLALGALHDRPQAGTSKRTYLATTISFLRSMKSALRVGSRFRRPSGSLRKAGPCPIWLGTFASGPVPEAAETYSITLSASASNLGGISSPSTLAVLRLITSSNFADCSIGRSVVFVPLIIFPT